MLDFAKKIFMASAFSALISPLALADTVTGVYTCNNAVVITLNGSKKLIARAIDGSTEEDEAYLERINRLAISLMESGNREVEYRSIGSAYACSTSGSFVTEFGVK